MRVLFLPLITTLLVLSYGAPAHAQSRTLATNLALGSTGAQVIVLQQLLNRDPDTRVASAGPGSLGNETSYFGILTRAAVIRFQEKYAGDILAPAGALRGSGYVGFYTREKLNALSISATASTQVSTASPAPPATPGDIQNPNLENLDKFLAAIDTVAAKEGISTTELATIKEQVIKAVATTTNLRATFLKMLQSESSAAAQKGSLMDQVVAAVRSIFNQTFMPERAHAAVGVPFGGALLFPFYCWNSFTWLLTVQPLPPTFVTLLSYVPGSQAFLSYNIPFTHELLGEYIPGGVCVFACPTCIFIPAQGTITPVVGSSLL